MNRLNSSSSSSSSSSSNQINHSGQDNVEVPVSVRPLSRSQSEHQLGRPQGTSNSEQERQPAVFRMPPGQSLQPSLSLGGGNLRRPEEQRSQGSEASQQRERPQPGFFDINFADLESVSDHDLDLQNIEPFEIPEHLHARVPEDSWYEAMRARADQREPNWDLHGNIVDSDGESARTVPRGRPNGAGSSSEEDDRLTQKRPPANCKGNNPLPDKWPGGDDSDDDGLGGSGLNELNGQIQRNLAMLREGLHKSSAAMLGKEVKH